MRFQSKDTFYKDLASRYANEAKMLRCTAAIHVEATSDKIFWEKIFKYLLPEKKFHFIAYTQTKDNKEATGCAICLKYKKLGYLSDKFFICIDSDYRYLLEEKGIDAKNFVFQTYTYSIENHWCYPDNINSFFNKCGLQNTKFDFNRFLIDYSATLYELFLYHLYSLSVGDRLFTKEQFRAFLNISNPCSDSSRMINKLRDTTASELDRLKVYYNKKILLKDLENKYYQFGLKKENAYLYFRGHNVFEQVIVRIAAEVKEELQKEQQTQRLSNTAKRDYYNSKKQENFIAYFSEDLCFDKYEEIKKIEKDIKNHFK